MISLQRYNQPKRTFSLYIPKKPFLAMAPNNLQTTLPKLCIPNCIEHDEIINTSNKAIPKIKSFNATNKKAYKPDVDNEVSKFISITANKHMLSDEINVQQPPQLPQPTDPSFNNVFLQKIKICNLIFDFNQQCQLKAKEIKNESLNELNILFTKKNEALLLNEQQKSLIYKMIMRNIYDQDPFAGSENVYPTSIKWSFIEPSWDQLKIVYQILTQFISHFPEIFKIDFVKNTIRLMNLPVSDERNCLLTVLKIYSSIHPDQIDEIWKIVKNAISNVISDIYTPYCVEPILSFCNTSIRTDYLHSILYTHLLPLFRKEQLSLYSVKLTDLIIKVIDKNMDLQSNAIEFLIKYFPYQCGQKQFLFISSISSIFEIIIGNDLNGIASKLVSFLKVITKSPNNKLAESAIKLLTSASMTHVLFKNTDMSIQSLYDSLNWSSLNHWDNSVKMLSKKALTILGNIILEIQKKKGKEPLGFLSSRVNPVANKNSIKQVQDTPKTSENQDLVAKWAQIARNAAKMDRSIDLTNSLLLIQKNLLNEKQSTEERLDLRNYQNFSFRKTALFDLHHQTN